jgi:hypothetical protein
MKTISQQLIYTQPQDKPARLLEILQKSQDSTTLVFTQTKMTGTEIVSVKLVNIFLTASQPTFFSTTCTVRTVGSALLPPLFTVTRVRQVAAIALLSFSASLCRAMKN